MNQLGNWGFYSTISHGLFFSFSLSSQTHNAVISLLHILLLFILQYCLGTLIRDLSTNAISITQIS